MRIILRTHSGKELTTTTDDTNMQQVVDRFSDLDKVTLCHEKGWDFVVPHSSIETYAVALS